MVTDIHLDTFNREIILEATQLRFTVQEIGSKTKELLQQATNIDDDRAFTWSGFELLPGGNRTGIVMVMDNGWTIRAEAQGSQTRIIIEQGIILPEGAGDPLETATNVIYSLAEQTVSSITNFGQRMTDIEDQLGIFNELESTSDGSKKFKVKVRGDPNTSKREYDIDNENAPRKVTPV